MALGSGVEAAALYATVGADIGNAVNNLTRASAAFEGVERAAQSAARSGDRFGVEAAEWASDFGLVAEKAATASVNIDRLARRREMPLADADALRARLDAIGSEADHAGAEMAQLAREGKTIDSARSAQLATTMQRLEQETRDATSQMVKLDHSVDAAATSGGKFSGIMRGMALAAGALGFTGITYALVGFVRGMVTGAAQLEQFRVKFEVMLGSAEAANDRLAELREFGKTTPFELPEIIAASSTLEVFTKGALSAGEGLRLVGDVAAGTGQRIDEIAMWFGRLYDAIQSGMPFGEAMMRLQEMGAIGGDARRRIEELAKSVKSGGMTMEEAWAGAAGEFSRFNGMMDKQSKTLGGQWSNLMDAIGIGLQNMGTKLMPTLKEMIPAAIDGFTALFAAITPVIQVLSVGLALSFEHLLPIVAGFTAMIGIKLVRSLEGATVKAKIFDGVMKSLKYAWIAFIPLAFEATDALDAFVFGLTHSTEEILGFNKMLEAAGGNRKYAESLMEMGVTTDDFARVVEQAGGDVQLAWKAMVHSAGEVGPAFAELGGDVSGMTTGWAEAWKHAGSTLTSEGGKWVTQAQHIGGAVAGALADPAVEEAAIRMAAEVEAAVAQARTEAAAEMTGMISDIISILSSSHGDLREEGRKLREDIVNPYKDVRQIIDLQTELAMEALLAGLESGSTPAATEVTNQVDEWLRAYDLLEPGALERGKAFNPALREGINTNLDATLDWVKEHVIGDYLSKFDSLPEALEAAGFEGLAKYAAGIEAARQEKLVRQAQAVGETVRSNLNIAGQAYQWGVSVGTSYDAGVGTGIDNAAWIISGKVAAMKDVMGMSGSPMFTHSRQLGEGVGESYIAGILRKLNTGKVNGALAGMFGPGIGDGAAPSGGAFSGSGSEPGEIHYHFDPTVQVEGDVRARDPEELVTGMSRLASVQGGPRYGYG